MSECTHDCSTCGEACASREPESFLKPLHEGASVKKVIAVVSGKGGVGKSLVTSLMASEMQRRGYNCAVLDADITGPSIPKSFGIHQHATGTEEYLIPVTTHSGIQVMSINLILQDETEPVVWRGPVIAGAVEMMKVPMLGIVENMSYYKCPDCGSEHSIFGESKVEALAKQYNIPHFAKLPIDPVITTMVDAGEVESVSGEHIAPLMDSIEKEI